MHFGFTIIYQNLKKQQKNTEASEHYFVFPSKDGKSSFNFYYLKNERFAEDKLFSENTPYIFGIDGVILNKSKLLKAYGISSWDKLFLQLFENKGPDFVNELNGEFSGFIFNKSSEQLFYFVNQTGSKKVYYHHDQAMFILAPSLQKISNFLGKNDKSISLNRDAAYHLLTFGGMPDNATLMDQVFRLSGGEFLLFEANKFQLKKYLDYNDTKINKDSEQKVIQDLEDQFQAALHLEYQKEPKDDQDFLATLSGGLDSRMNVFLAAKAGYPITNLCFSQSGYDDEKIAKDIAKHLNQAITFIPLDEGKYVLDFDENMNIYEGQIYYTASAHFNYAIKKMDISPYSLIHSGLLGDGVLGTHITKPYTAPPDFHSKLTSKKLFHKVESSVNQLAKNYVSEDVFNLQQRFSNIIISGAWAMEKYAYLLSPFMQPDFIRTCLSMPPAYKYQQKIYIKWINKFHPELTRFKWETTGMRPKYIWQKALSRYPKKVKSVWYRLNKKSHKLSMTPYDYWCQNSNEIPDFMEAIFNTKIELLNSDKELQKDVVLLFKNGNIVDKILAITLLGGIDLLNINP